MKSVLKVSNASVKCVVNIQCLTTSCGWWRCNWMNPELLYNPLKAFLMCVTISKYPRDDVPGSKENQPSGPIYSAFLPKYFFCPLPSKWSAQPIIALSIILSRELVTTEKLHFWMCLWIGDQCNYYRTKLDTCPNPGELPLRRAALRWIVVG